MKNQIKQLLNFPVRHWQRHHNAIRNNQHRADRYVAEIMPDQSPPNEWVTIYYKGYSRMKQILLPEPKLANTHSLKKALTKRQSKKKFSQHINNTDLSTLLYYAAGINKQKQSGSRFYPSGGARYPLEVYVLAQNTQIARGVYHYYVRNHSIEGLAQMPDLKIQDYFLKQFVSPLKSASLTVIITAVFDRTMVKYGDRGYNICLLEAGHLMQNMCLIAPVLGYNICPIGGYIEEKLEKLLDLDTSKESVLYAVALG